MKERSSHFLSPATQTSWVIAPVPRSGLEEWQALLKRSFVARWGAPYGRPGFFLDYVSHNPRFRSGQIMGLFVADRLVSTYQVFRRQMVIAGHTYRLEGLGNIATVPELQKQGCGTALMRWFLRQGCAKRDLAIVYAREGAFYRQLGWQPFTRGALIVWKVPTGLGMGDMLLGRRPMEEGDLSAVGRIYSRFNRAEGVPYIVRSGAYWRRWIWDWKLKIYRLRAEVVVTPHDRPIGYLFYRVAGGCVIVEEYAALPSRYDEIYAAVIAMARQFGAVRGLMVTRAVSSFARYLNEQGIAYKKTDGPDELGHSYVFNQTLMPWRDRIALWHVDHF